MKLQTAWWVACALSVLAAPACGGDDDDDGAGEGEGEFDARVDILVDGAEGVLDGVLSVRGYFLSAGVTSCDGLMMGRVQPSAFPNRREPVLEVRAPPASLHITAEIQSGSSLVFVQCYPDETGEAEPVATGCDENVYAAPGETASTRITVRLNP